jgi:hypothetical protein
MRVNDACPEACSRLLGSAGRVGQARGQLDEHAYAVAARPRADRVAAIVIE